LPEDRTPNRQKLTSQRSGHARLVRGLDAVSPARPVSVLAADTQDRSGDAAESVPQGIWLRPICADDRGEYVRLAEASRNELERWLPAFAMGQTAASHFEDELERAVTGDESRTAFRRLVMHRQSIVGTVSLINISRGLTLSADVSWWIGTPMTRRGYARAALRLLLRQAFGPIPDGLGLHRLCATIDPANEPSVRLASACGFARYPAEDHHLLIGQEWKRHHCYVAEIHTSTFTELKPAGPRVIELS
jgi:ribosomal-protein-alanine N-acetyltransferase